MSHPKSIKTLIKHLKENPHVVAKQGKLETSLCFQQHKDGVLEFIEELDTVLWNVQIGTDPKSEFEPSWTFNKNGKGFTVLVDKEKTVYEYVTVDSENEEKEKEEE